MLTIPHQQTGGKLGQLEAGSWDWCVWGGWTGEPARRVPAIACPTCSRLFCLANHTLDAEGHASPSVVCPHEGCTFHVFLEVADYSVAG